MGTRYELVIANKNLSSWSLRPWLLLKVLAIPFSETRVRLRRPESRADILRHSPSGKVPLLKSGGILVWDSLAIIEFTADEHAGKSVWPLDKAARALARAVSAEMHSGFYALRQEMPMDFVNVRRRRFGGGGEFLFGAFSGADAMYAPVVSRFISYAADLAAFGDDGTAARYRDMMMALPEMQEWAAGAKAEIDTPSRD